MNYDCTRVYDMELVLINENILDRRIDGLIYVGIQAMKRFPL